MLHGQGCGLKMCLCGYHLLHTLSTDVQRNKKAREEGGATGCDLSLGTEGFVRLERPRMVSGQLLALPSMLNLHAYWYTSQKYIC